MKNFTRPLRIFINSILPLQTSIPLFSAAFLIALAIFLYGFAAGRTEIFPGKIVMSMCQTLVDLRTLFVLEVSNERSANEINVPFQSGGVVTLDPQRSQPGYTFIALFREGEFRCILIDERGTELHSWDLPFSSLEFLTTNDLGITLSSRNIIMHGSHLYENGDLLVSVEYTGLVKINKNSEVIWSLLAPTHHSVAVDTDGSIWTLTRRQFEHEQDAIPSSVIPYWDNLILHLSPDGEVLEEKSIFYIILDSAYERILLGGPPDRPGIAYDDPLHANDIDVLSASDASKFFGVEAGDLMISLRHINAVIVVDRERTKILWSMVGPFLRQHDPEVDKEGNLWVFDNRTTVSQFNHAIYLTEPRTLGYSRILSIDPAIRSVKYQYQGMADRPFYTSVMGRLQPLDNGNVLVVEPEAGRVFEIDSETSNVVWSFVNLLEPGWVGRVAEGERYDAQSLSFVSTK